jgi:hypothetical protein
VKSVMIKGAALALTLSASLLSASRASANPRPLPFTYIYETLPEGETELEQYVDYTPVKALSSSGRAVYYGASQFQTEFEYGITDRLELGLYVTFAPKPGDSYAQVPSLIEGNGIKQRLRLRVAEEGQWPLAVALYGELTEKRFGDFRAVANLWAEREFYFENRRDWVLNPTAGITYQVSPTVTPGIEYWMRVEFPDPAPSPRPFNVGPHQFVGPTLMLNLGRLWWTNGVYVRLNEFGRSLQPGDAFGSVWFRTVIGVGF